jgi:hypothetical protein
MSAVSHEDRKRVTRIETLNLAVDIRTLRVVLGVSKAKLLIDRDEGAVQIGRYQGKSNHSSS